MVRHGSGRTILVPILGVVRAGAPIPLPSPDSLLLEVLNVPYSDRIPATGVFGLIVRGNSMIDAKVYDGDTVIIKPQRTAANGDLAIVRLHVDPTNSQTTFKRFYRDGDKVRLRPENSEFDELCVSAKDVEIIGVVLAVWRSKQGARQRMISVC